MDTETIKSVEKIIGYKFKNKSLLLTALTHSSFANLNGVQSNERLEFLGDTVLSTIVSEQIFNDMDYNEGQLSKLRARIVSMQPLAQLATRLKIDKYMLFAGNQKKRIITDSMKADLLEAIIGAMYVDSGIKSARTFVLSKFNLVIKANEELNVLDDSKSYLQEHFKNQQIKYVTTKSGKDHKPCFTSSVYINGILCGKGVGSTKKNAEQLAASESIKKLTKV